MQKRNVKAKMNVTCISHDRGRKTINENSQKAFLEVPCYACLGRVNVLGKWKCRIGATPELTRERLMQTLGGGNE